MHTQVTFILEMEVMLLVEENIPVMSILGMEPLFVQGGRAIKSINMEENTSSPTDSHLRETLRWIKM